MAAANLVADYFKLWEKSGKTEFLKLCRSQNDSSFVSGKESRTLKQSLYELCWQVLKGNVKVEPAVSVISDICDNVKDLPSVLADIFAIIDTEIGALEDKNTREKYTLLISACDIIIPAPVLKERIDQEVLESIGLIPSKLQFQQKYVKTKTKLYYKQQKFNLLREESEGYAKLITELMQEITDEVTSKQSVENLKSLIGCFDLDPNRVLDTMLECFECRPHLSSFYIPIFKDYVTEQKTLCHILGFKFHFYQEEETPASLYKIAALLLQNNLIDLESLYPHLLPPDSKIKEYHQKDIDEAKAYARKLNVVSLSDKADDSKDGDAVKVDLYVTNQKLGLCEALLNLGAWQKAKEILDRLPEFFATVHKPIASAICSLVHVMMDPLYRQNSGLPKKVLKGRISSHSHGYKSVHRVKTYRELHSEVLPIMRYLGPYASCDPVLLVKIVRLGKSFMTKRQSGGISPDDDVAYYGFLNMLDELLLPSMSMLPFNCCLSEELWSLLKLYPYELRYRLYGNWKNDTYSHHPKLIRIRADCLERAKYLMKRLSKENVKPSGRQLGKLSHSNPGVLFEYVLSQIQRYDNFIGPVVDTLKYLTSLSYDILAYCIIEALANPEKDRMKHDDTNISLWLQSLANFAGSICRKYQVELAGLMQYVANQLKSGKSFDLLLLREIVTKMAGIEISEEITDDQLDAMSGGELLRQEGGYFAQVRNTKKSSTRLKDALLEHDLALSLCLLMAQQREGVIYKEGAESHLKLVGKLYDQCQDTLVQFGSFLSMQLSTEEFVKRLPSIDVLMTSYNVPADAAFFLCRPQYAYATNSKFEELRKIDKSNKQTGSQQKLIRYSEASEECMSPVIELVRPLYSARVWEDLSPQFYVTFWSLSMYDLAVPSNVYDKQIQQLTAQISATEDNKDLPQSKKKKEKERCSNLIDKLKDEMKKQGEHCNRVKERLKSQKEQWFISRSTKNETITQFLQLCIFPRCCFTASDAVYCAKFIHLLHDLKTPNFSTLICCDRIFCDITYTVTSCTENEAHRYGRFLCSTLNIIMKWHSSKEIYDKECAAYPGFVTVFRKGTDSVNKADQLDYENYRHVCHKWHFRITKAMVACLESGNYIQIRNALIVLTKLLPNYPRVFQFGQALERRVDRLRQEEKEKRPDIYALAMGYSGQLKGKKSTWVQENVFHQKETKGQKAASQASSKNDENAAKKNSESRGNSRKTENSENKSKEKEKEPKDKEKKSSEKKDKSESKSKLDMKKAIGDKKEQINGTTKSSEKNKDREKEDKIIIKAEKMSKGYGDEKSSKESSKISKDKEEKSSNSQSKHSKEERKEIIADHIKEEKREEKLPRSKEEPRDRKEEKREKEEHRSEKSSRIKLDKHEKVKIKRILSPEKKESGDRDYKDQDAREHEREVTERANSVGSIESRGSGSHHRRSPDSSPKYVEERDSKRRKLESASSESKEKRDRSHSRERHRKSPSNERDREREKKDRKRLSYDAPDDRNELEVKRRKSVEPSPSHSSSKVNGDSDKYHSKKDKDSDKKSEKSDGSHGKIKVSKESHVSSDISPQRTKSKDKDRDREKSKNKDKSKSSSSSKKSKK